VPSLLFTTRFAGRHAPAQQSQVIGRQDEGRDIEKCWAIANLEPRQELAFQCSAEFGGISTCFRLHISQKQYLLLQIAAQHPCVSAPASVCECVCGEGRRKGSGNLRK